MALHVENDDFELLGPSPGLRFAKSGEKLLTWFWPVAAKLRTRARPTKSTFQPGSSPEMSKGNPRSERVRSKRPPELARRRTSRFRCTAGFPETLWWCLSIDAWKIFSTRWSYRRNEAAKASKDKDTAQIPTRAGQLNPVARWSRRRTIATASPAVAARRRGSLGAPSPRTSPRRLPWTVRFA